MIFVLFFLGGGRFIFYFLIMRSHPFFLRLVTMIRGRLLSGPNKKKQQKTKVDNPIDDAF